MVKIYNSIIHRIFWNPELLEQTFDSWNLTFGICLDFGACDLEFVWYLVFVIWNLTKDRP
jgi:hypothetical protein